MTLKVRIIATDETLYDGMGEMAILPGIEGELAILPQHVPMIVTLGAGIVKIKQLKELLSFNIKGGIAHITREKVDILAD